MSRAEFEEIEHTADWAIRVNASDLDSLFERAAQGMFELIGCANLEAKTIIRPITLQAADLETLLVSWLEELLYLLDTENLMFTKASLQIPSEKQLLASISLLPTKEQWKEIKAVTFHNLKVNQVSNGFEVTIVFDV